MLIPLDRKECTGPLDATICVVGAGAAGITLACELDGIRADVILLEAGGLRMNQVASDEMYRGTSVAPHPDPCEFRRVVFGGTTTIWGGRCVPLDPIDFEPRDYVRESGWPISYGEVARHYARALEYCDAGTLDFSAGGSLGRDAPMFPGLHDNSVLLADRIERYSLPTDFGRRHRSRIAQSQNVTALLNARCIALNKRPGQDLIDSATVVDRAGRRRRVRARIFVLAMGGIETPRLMFNSDPDGAGLGNQSGTLGRFYACHFENVLGRVVATQGKVAFDFEKTLDGVYCRRKLQFTEAAQRRHRLLNCAFRLHFPAYADASHGSAVMSAIYLVKSSLIPEYRAILQQGAQLARSPRSEHVHNVAAGLPQLGRFAFEWLFRRVLARRKLPYTLERNADGSFPLEFNSEQTPHRLSRISLTHDADRDGLRRVHIDWRICSDDAEAAHRAFLLLRKELRKSTSCRLELDDTGLERSIAASMPLGGHHIGTARMAATPRDGVVDGNCAVFDLPNLFIAGSAVFRTSGHANPTLTIVALALRLAEHLKSILPAYSVPPVYMRQDSSRPAVPLP